MSVFDTEATVDPTKEYLAEMVGEGKTYKDVEQLAKAALHKELHIRRLENETAQLRNELSSRPTEDRLQAIVDKIDSLKLQPQPQPEPQAPPPVVAPTVSEKDVEQILLRREAAIREQANLDRVKAALVERFGPNYGPHVKQIQNTLGIGDQFLEQTAKASPEAFLALFAPAAPVQQSLTAPPVSSTNGFRPNSGERTESYYAKLRAENPKEYNSARVQAQQMQDAIRLGAAYFDKT